MTPRKEALRHLASLEVNLDNAVDLLKDALKALDYVAVDLDRAVSAVRDVEEAEEEEA